MKRLIRSNPVVSFIVITFIFSWTLWLLMILSNKGLLPFRFPTNFMGSFGPAAGALIVTAVTSGKKGIISLLKSILKWRSSLQTWLFAIFFIIIAYGLTIGITMITNPGLIEFQNFPGIAELILYFLIIAVVGGPLGEETGWRGFLQPVLLKRFSPLTASLMIALVWFTWHIPLFWLEGAAQSGGSQVFFAISVLSMAFLFTLLYIKTDGSLLLAILFHTMINFVSAYILPTVLPAAEADKTFGRLSVFVIAGLTIVMLIVCRRLFITRPATDQ